MEFCYGEKNHIRILEEAKFWKRQEAEHTVVIREIAPNLEEEYVNKLKEFQAAFSDMEATIVQFIERLARMCYMLTPGLVQEIRGLINTTLHQSQMFVMFLEKIKKESSAINDNPVANVVINHIMRESEYYIGIAKAYLSYTAYMAYR